MRFLICSFALFFISIAGHAADYPYKEVTAEEILALQKEFPDIVIIDSRAPEQLKDGMIAGAINLPVYDTDAEHLAAVAPDKNTPLLFYCNDVTCGASALAAFYAQKAGYSRLYKYPGGIKEWLEKGLPVTLGKE